MKKLNCLEDLSTLDNNSIAYCGVLDKYQIHGADENGIKYQHYKLTDYQNLLYKRALNGLNMYTKEEKKKMHWEKKKRIQKVSKRAQESVNLFKQERVNEICDDIYRVLYPFGASKGMQFFLCSEKVGTDPEFINTLELKDLGITKKHVIGKFIQEGILPKDFYELKEIA